MSRCKQVLKKYLIPAVIVGAILQSVQKLLLTAQGDSVKYARISEMIDGLVGIFVVLLLLYIVIASLVKIILNRQKASGGK